MTERHPAVVWLKRPEKANALRLGDIEALDDEIDSRSADPAVSGVIIAARGRNFCAGVDLAEFSEGTPESGARLINALHGLCETARRVPKPVAVCIQGACVGGALELAVSADFRVCTEDARFAMPEVFIGIPSVIHASLLERYLGLGRAHEMLLTGEPMDAAEALQRGLVNRVVGSAEELVPAAEVLVRQVARHHPAAIRVQKQLFREWLDRPFTKALDSSARALVSSFETGAPQELARRRSRKQG